MKLCLVYEIIPFWGKRSLRQDRDLRFPGDVQDIVSLPIQQDYSGFAPFRHEQLIG